MLLNELEILPKDTYYLSLRISFNHMYSYYKEMMTQLSSLKGEACQWKQSILALS